MFYLGTFALPAPCPLHWTPFESSSCLKIFENLPLQTFTSAAATCKLLNAHLLIIKTQEQQRIISNLLSTIGLVDNIWLGAHVIKGDILWIDNEAVKYANWASEGPRRKAGYCVQMLSDEETQGQWIDVPCGRKNLVVCQGLKTDNKNGYNYNYYNVPYLEELKKVKESLEKTESRLKSLEENPIPVGFLYTQLPGQVDPSCLWPQLSFEDVTAEYAGYFFRAEGATSNAFGAQQEESSPRLSAVFGEHSYENRPVMGEVLLREGWSANVFAGYEPQSGSGQGWAVLRFKIDADEVRPRNMAVKIWRRC